MEERSAIAEHHGGATRRRAEQIAGFPDTYKGAETYLLTLIENQEPLIHLYGENPHICKVRTFSSYEPDICIQRGWIDRGFALQALSTSKYEKRGRLWCGKVPAEIWHFRTAPSE
jgi:hypothetical protein